MSLGTFKIPVEEYYSKSRSFRDKVEELRDDVEDNFIRLVSSNIGSLDSRDQNAVEGISAYLKAKQELQILNEHIERLNKMSLEGSGNPLDRVVQLDKDYSQIFKNIGNGASSVQVVNAVSHLESEYQIAKFKRDFAATVSTLASGERTILANLLGMTESDLVSWIASGFHGLTSVDDVTSLLDTLYTGSGKGISFQTLLYSDEIGVAMRQSRFVEKILTVLMDLPYSLKSTNWAKAISDITGKVSPYISNLKIVGSIAGGQYVNAAGSFLKDFIKSDGVKLGGEALAWSVLAVEGGMNLYSEWNSTDTDSKTVVGKVAKTALGATIDTVSNIGPLDGMWLGAKIGASSTHPVGIVAGSLFGLGVGTANLIGDVFFPEQKQAVYGAIKDGAYWLVDRGEELAENTGKAIQAGWEELKSVGNNISEFFNGGAKMEISWFG
ncbi:hypothetical protein [Streptococcus suis]|uniref:hypothetical protein n=1 Tax=Streptococcus suis TaxID=1307 RepID=UPI00241029C2|nr:hypothetical protein [Streptococcus suis]MDG3136532.1 hypothetical protein [Streptococcus suis]